MTPVENTAVPPAAQPESMSIAHILVVEVLNLLVTSPFSGSFPTQDNPINQAVLKRQLLVKKYAVTVANNGQEALDILFAASTPRIDCW